DQYGINDQWPAPIVCAHPKANPTQSFYHVAAADFMSDAVDRLIEDRFLPAHIAAPRSQHEVTVRIYAHLSHSIKRKLDGCGISPRSDNEVVFQVPLVAVVDQIHSGIDGLVFDLGIV